MKPRNAPQGLRHSQAGCRPPRIRWAASSLALAASLLATGAIAAPQPPRWVSGELIVAFRAGVSPTQRFNIFRNHGATVVEDIGNNQRLVRIRVPVPLLDLAQRLLVLLPQVKFVEKNYEFEPALVPDDTQYVDQWHLPRIQAPQAWDLTQGTAGAVIAILDSGVDATHPDLASKLVPGYNTYSGNTSTTDTYGHGTEVAGAAAALTNNGQGVAGVAGGAPIMPVRVTDGTGRATSASIANGIIWAADHGARVLNLSFNGIAGNATIRTAAEYATNRGSLVVAASGNCGCVDPTPDNPFILSVSATDEADGLLALSSTGPFVDLAAPGNNIFTTAMFGLYLSDSGTSLASPIVAGVAALMFAAQPTLTPAAATQLLASTAVPLGGSAYNASFGHGRVDALAAVTAAAAYTPPPDTTPPSLAMASPLAGATLSATAVVDVTATDDVGVTKVDLLVDGSLFVSDVTSPYSFAWDTSTLANGPHTLQAVATDAAGNSASTTAITVNVSNVPPDTTPPALAFGSPAAGATVAGTTTVSANASDNVAVARVDLYLDAALYASKTAAPYTFAWNTLATTDGAHTLKLVAVDTAGNSANTSVSVTVANVVNHAPVAGNDSFTAPFRARQSYTAQVLNVLANDSDVDGNLKPSTVKIVNSPNKGGSVSVNSNGRVSYTPKLNYRGTETFSYNVKDTLSAVSNTATVTVNVQ